MPTLSSDNNIGILIKADADLKAVDDTSKELGKLDSAADSTSRRAAVLGSVAKVAAVGIAAAGAATAAAGVLAIKSAGDYEQSRIAFETMLGSADKARGLMNDIAQFAKTTPFELPEVVAGTKQLLAFGFEQQQLLPTMKKLGDLASGLGVPIGQLTNVYGQVKVAGRLMGQDLLQFTNAGVPMIQALADTMKKPQSEIKALVEQGKVGFPEVETALNSLTGEGSKFGGMMDKQSHSFNGVVSNIKDGFGQMLRSAVGISPAGDIVAGSVFDKIKKAAETAMPKIGEMIPTVTAAVTTLVNVLMKVFAAFSVVFGFLNQHRIILAIIAGIIGGLLVAAFVSWAVAATAAAIATLAAIWPFLLIGAVVGGVAYLIVGHWEMIKAKTIAIWNAITGFVSGAIDWFKNNWLEAIGFVIGFFATLPIKLPIFIYQAVASIIGFLSRVDWAGVWNSIKTAFGNAVGGMWDAMQGLWKRITSLDWGSIFTNAAKGIGNGIIALLEGAINGALKGIPGKPHVSIPRFENGVRDFSGGLALVGEAGPELVNLPSGSDVFTNKESRAMTTHNNRNVSIGTVIVQGESAGRGFWSGIDQDSMLIGQGLTPNRGF
jgi:tape measure domain-containing protein